MLVVQSSWQHLKRLPVTKTFGSSVTQRLNMAGRLSLRLVAVMVCLTVCWTAHGKRVLQQVLPQNNTGCTSLRVKMEIDGKEEFKEIDLTQLGRIKQLVVTDKHVRL